MVKQPKNLLIVENLPGNWLTQEEYLRIEHQFHIVLSSSLEDARNHLSRTVFHAVLSDYFLVDGICTDLVSYLGNVPLIVILSKGDEDIALLALKTGAENYLVKDSHWNYIKLVPLIVNKSIDQKIQSGELEKYRTQLENIVEERTIELIDMYSKLQDSETNFKNIFNSTNEGIVIIDFQLGFVEANDAVLKQFNVTKEFLVSHVLMDYVVTEYKINLLKRLDQVKQGFPSGIIELEFISPGNGTIMPYEVSSVPIVFNQKNAILSIMRDIAERKNHERKLFETIIQTEEDERTRIARDLHDEIGPLISALKIFTTSFIESQSAEKKEKLANQMGIIVRDVIESIKTISNDMSPHVLVNFGIIAAIQNFIDLFSKDIQICLSSNIGDTRFPTTVESLIYRIIKELINNTVKHAHASEVNIILEYANNTLVCSYKDNGIGFNWNQQVRSKAKGMGINNIITRIRSLGGDFEVNAGPEQGFDFKFILQTGTKDVTG